MLHCKPAVLQTLLGLATPSDPRLKSGTTSLERPLSSAVQTFQEKREDWPLKQPLPKTTALLQVSFRAQELCESRGGRPGLLSLIT